MGIMKSNLIVQINDDAGMNDDRYGCILAKYHKQISSL